MHSCVPQLPERAIALWWGESNVILISLLVGSIGFVLRLLAQSYAAVLITTGFFVLTATFLRPSIRSLTSQNVTLSQGAAILLMEFFLRVKWLRHAPHMAVHQAVR
jgi:hypothetical protein